MNTSSGTPKTLQGAIKNGLVEATQVPNIASPQEQFLIVERHVLDWLRQQFSWGYLHAEEVDELGVSQCFHVMRELARRLGVETDAHSKINDRDPEST